MSTSLYREAILEVEDLKKMAEQNAKNKIIEAVTPQIRSIIEAQLLGEDDSEELEIGDLEVGDAGEEVIDLAIPAPLPPLPAEEPLAAPKIAIDVQGDLNIDMETDDMIGDDDLLLGRELTDVVENYILNKRSTKGRIRALAENVVKFKTALRGVDLRNVGTAKANIATLYYAKLVNEAVSLATGGIVMEESVDSRLLSQLKIIIKEIKHMARRKDAAAFRRLLEELEADQSLREMIREEDEDAVEVDDDVALEDEEVDVDVAPEEADVPAAQDALGTLAAALGMEAVPVEDVEIDVDEEVAIDDEDEEVLELGESDWLGESDDTEDDTVEEEDETLDEVYEIDERMLRRELRRLREEAAQAGDADPEAGEEVGDPMDSQESWGGSEEVIDVSEDDLVNALEEEINRMRSVRKRTARRSTPRRRLQRESARRTTRRRKVSSPTSRRAVVAERAARRLRGQLNEMNVFNAKLLFANKLMQNRDLSAKQQRAIVEALDSAKTINEAKLLYKSLSASLSKSGGRLSEGRNRLLASSSRSARSASPAKNGAEVDRWALLAGISGDGNK